MPSKTAKQRRFMAMCSTPAGRAKAQGKCPPQHVAREFRHADAGKASAKAARTAKGYGLR